MVSILSITDSRADCRSMHNIRTLYTSSGAQIHTHADAHSGVQWLGVYRTKTHAHSHTRKR